MGIATQTAASSPQRRTGRSKGHHQVVVVALADDLHARAVVHALRGRGIPVAWVDFADPAGVPRVTLSFTDSVEATLHTESGTTVRLSAVDTVWWRRPRAPDPPVQFDTATRDFFTSEWEHFLGSLEAVVHTRWVNSPAASRVAGRKVNQTIAARRVGLRTPRTLVTNDPQQVRAFASQGTPLIYKRLGTAPRPLTATKELGPRDLERLDALTNCPAIFQERIDARSDIRATIIGNDVYAAEIHSQAGVSPLDWRFDHTVPFRPHRLDEAVYSQLLALMRGLGLLYGAADLRLTPDGEYVFLEVNPGGQYLFLDLLADSNLTDRMAEFLARG
jgi:hypothetical protein